MELYKCCISQVKGASHPEPSLEKTGTAMSQDRTERPQYISCRKGSEVGDSEFTTILPNYLQNLHFPKQLVLDWTLL